MTVAVASGKGGTGKTTLAVSLARAFGAPLQLVDCDVEAPNAHLFVTHDDAPAVRIVQRLVPQVDPAACQGCGRCAAACRHNAIVVPRDTALVFTELCHACGGCAAACPHQAITEVEEQLGVVETFHSGSLTVIQGRLDVGRPTAPPVISAAREQTRGDQPALLDAPPGTACPAVATLRGVDYAVLVTEPTPFGLHDLQLAVELARELGVPHGVIVNRAGADHRVHTWCASQGVEVLLELPDDRRVAEAYVAGRPLIDALPEYREPLAALARRLLTPGAETRA